MQRIRCASIWLCASIPGVLASNLVSVVGEEFEASSIIDLTGSGSIRTKLPWYGNELVWFGPTVSRASVGVATEFQVRQAPTGQLEFHLLASTDLSRQLEITELKLQEFQDSTPPSLPPINDSLVKKEANTRKTAEIP